MDTISVIRDDDEGGRKPLTITLVVSPVAPGCFEARLDGDCIVASSRTPFCDAARKLIDLGYDRAAILVMKHAGTEIVALRAPLLKAAKLNVEEGPYGPRFVAFRTGPKTRVAAPPVAPSAAAVPPTGSQLAPERACYTPQRPWGSAP
jgi:hypothetical protein